MKSFINLHPTLSGASPEVEKLFEIERSIRYLIDNSEESRAFDEASRLQELKRIRLIKSAFIIAGYDPYSDKGLADLRSRDCHIIDNRDEKRRDYIVDGKIILTEDYKCDVVDPVQDKDGSFSMKIIASSFYSINSKEHK